MVNIASSATGISVVPAEITNIFESISFSGLSEIKAIFAVSLYFIFLPTLSSMTQFFLYLI